MKKSFLTVAAVSFVALCGSLLISCGDTPDGYIANENELVMSLSTPEVSAKAYPGVNYVYWNSVQDTDKYRITKLANDIEIKSETVTVLNYTDTDISNGVKYTYKVQALGNVAAGRSVYTSDSEAGSASVTGIVPPVSTSALNMAAYEGGYDGTQLTAAEKDAANLITADNIAVAKEKNSIGLSFITKAYLNYTLYADKGNYSTVTDKHVTKYLTSSVDKNNNDVVTSCFNVYSAGTYTISVKAASANPDFVVTDTVTASTKVTYNSLGVDNPTPSVVYTDEGKTVRIRFSPVTLEDGSKALASYYKVYRSIYGKDDWLPVSTEEMTKAAGSNDYELEDTITDNTKKYEYIIVVTDGTSFGNEGTVGVLNAYAPVYPTISWAYAGYKDAGKTILIGICANTMSDGSVPASKYFKVYKAVYGTEDWTEVSGTITKDFDSNDFILEDSITDNTVGYKYKVASVVNGTVYNTYYNSDSLDVDAYNASIPDIGSMDWTVEYINAETIRVRFNPYYNCDRYIGGKPDTSYFKVYRAPITSDEWTLVSGKVTEDIDSSYYIVDDEIEDNTIYYKYEIVLTIDGTSYSTITNWWVLPYSGSAPTVGTVDADYIDEGNTVRVKFQPNTLSDGSTASVSCYKVYKTIYGNSDWTLVSGTVKSALSTEVEGADEVLYYVVDDTITDNTVMYTYKVVATDGIRYSTNTIDVAAYTITSATGTVAKVSVAAVDKDNQANDITWKITTGDEDTTFKAYGPKVVDSALTYVPVASDFDMTKALTVAESAETDNKTFYVYTKNVAVGNAYIMVVFSKKGCDDKYVVSDAAAVAEETISAPDLYVTKYDASATKVNSTVKDDVIINVTEEDFDTTTASIDDYTYTLYRAEASLKSDVTAGTVTFSLDSTAKWKKVSVVTMKSNKAYDASATSIDYVGVVTQEDLSDGVYAYKVVKTNADGKSASAIKYITINTKSSIDYIPNDITASFVDAYDISGVSSVKITFTKDVETLDVQEIYGTDELASYPVSYTVSGQETPEAGVTYTIYRATLDSNETAVVYTTVGSLNSTTSGSNNYDDEEHPIYKLDSENLPVVDEYKYYVDSITYTYYDSGLSTSNSYDYIVVASKDGADDVVISDVTNNAKGAN